MATPEEIQAILDARAAEIAKEKEDQTVAEAQAEAKRLEALVEKIKRSGK